MRQEKQFLFDEIKEYIDNSQGFVLARYNALAPNLGFTFRSELRKTGARLCVLPKRVFLKATHAASIDVTKETLQGHVAVVFAYEDPLATTKGVFQFLAQNEGVLEVLGGQIDGKLYSSSDMKAISQLPSHQEMRAQFIGTLEAPMSNLLGVMQALLAAPLYCFENKIEKENK